jgi:glycosyltransferase involved in cell wall biosynthesis
VLKPVLSVIISVYEQPSSLSALLGCLRGQTYPSPFEVLICDDGSSAETLQIVRSFSDLDLRYIWQPDHGYRLARSRNNAIRCASGDTLIFLDGDLLIGPEFFAQHAAAHDGQKRIVCGSRKWVEAGSPSLAGAPDLSNEKEMQERWIRSATPWMLLIGCNFSVPRRPEIAFDERFVGWGSEDRELACRLVNRSGYEIVLDQQIEALHVVEGGESPSRNPLKRGKCREIEAFVRNKLYFFSKYPDVDVLPAMGMLVYCFLDRTTDRWHAGDPVPGRKVEHVIAEAQEWLQRRRKASQGLLRQI